MCTVLPNSAIGNVQTAPGAPYDGARGGRNRNVRFFIQPNTAFALAPDVRAHERLKKSRSLDLAVSTGLLLQVLRILYHIPAALVKPQNRNY